MPVPPPVKQSDISAVRTNYGIDAGFKPKGQSDSSLYAHSVDFVLAWWKKNSPAALAAGAAAAAGGTGGAASGSTGGAGGSGGGSGSSGGATMPDTALGTGGPAGGLAHILTPQEQQAQDLGNQRGAATAAKADPVPVAPVNLAPPAAAPFGSGRAQDTAPMKVLPPTPANPVPVSKATATSIMLQMGLKGVTPPVAAMKSTAALRAWAVSELAKQKLAAARGAQTAKKAGV